MSNTGLYLRDPVTGAYIRDGRRTYHGGTVNPNFGKYMRADESDPDDDDDAGAGNDCIGCGCRKDIPCGIDGMPGWILATLFLGEYCGAKGFDTAGPAVEIGGSPFTSYIKFLTSDGLELRGRQYRLSRRANYPFSIGGGSGGGGSIPPCTLTYECVRDLSCMSDYAFYDTYIEPGVDGIASDGSGQITDLPYNVQVVFGISVSPITIFGDTPASVCPPVINWQGYKWMGLRRATDPEHLPADSLPFPYYRASIGGMGVNLETSAGNYILPNPNSWNSTVISSDDVEDCTELAPGEGPMVTGNTIWATACGNL
jgi:hypothetical protein